MGILDRILRAGEGKKVKALAGLIPEINDLAVLLILQAAHRRDTADSTHDMAAAAGYAILDRVRETVDRCDGTLTRVVEGSVRVRDRVRHRTVIVRAGRSYLARAPER